MVDNRKIVFDEEFGYVEVEGRQGREGIGGRNLG